MRVVSVSRTSKKQGDHGSKWGKKNLTSSFVFSAIILWNPIPTPSITARNRAHMIAEFRAALNPPRIARQPPVKKPAITKREGPSVYDTDQE